MSMLSGLMALVNIVIGSKNDGYDPRRYAGCGSYVGGSNYVACRQCGKKRSVIACYCQHCGRQGRP